MSFNAYASFSVGSSQTGATDYVVQPLDSTGANMGAAVTTGLTSDFGWFGAVADGAVAARLTSVSKSLAATAPLTRDLTVALLRAVPSNSDGSPLPVLRVADLPKATLDPTAVAAANVAAMNADTTAGGVTVNAAKAAAFADRNPQTLAKPGDAMALTPAERTSTATAVRANLDSSLLNIKLDAANVTGTIAASGNWATAGAAMTLIPGERAAVATATRLNLDTNKLAVKLSANDTTGVFQSDVRSVTGDASLGNYLANMLADYAADGGAITATLVPDYDRAKTAASEAEIQALAALIGQQAGTGDTAVNHNTGGMNNLRYTTQAGVGIGGAIIYAYVKSEYVAGSRIVKAVMQPTKDDGTWSFDMMLNHGVTYILRFEKSGEYGPDFKDVTP